MEMACQLHSLSARKWVPRHSGYMRPCPRTVWKPSVWIPDVPPSSVMPNYFYLVPKLCLPCRIGLQSLDYYLFCVHSPSAVVTAENCCLFNPGNPLYLAGLGCRARIIFISYPDTFGYESGPSEYFISWSQWHGMVSISHHCLLIVPIFFSIGCHPSLTHTSSWKSLSKERVKEDKIRLDIYG